MTHELDPSIRVTIQRAHDQRLANDDWCYAPTPPRRAWRTRRVTPSPSRWSGTRRGWVAIGAMIAVGALALWL